MPMAAAPAVEQEVREAIQKERLLLPRPLPIMYMLAEKELKRPVQPMVVGTVAVLF
jgi:hypothetical protein